MAVRYVTSTKEVHSLAVADAVADGHGCCSLISEHGRQGSAHNVAAGRQKKEDKWNEIMSPNL
jgi:hypothetical protein